MKDNYDVIVVGAGFGGPVAAKRCADAGLRTLILERGRAPGDKVIASCSIPFYGFLFGPAFIREGCPPIERPVFSAAHYVVRGGEIVAQWQGETPQDPSVAPAVAYNVYCRPFCTWLVESAVAAGAELRTSTVAVDVIKEDGCVTGVVTDRGDELHCRVLIDAEGTQNVLAIKAGVRKRYKAEGMELCLMYDFMMDPDAIEQTGPAGLEFYWAMPGEHMVAPPGYGSAAYVFKYRNSVHLTIGRMLRSSARSAALAELLPAYYDTFFRNTRWMSVFAPKAKLRAVLWDTCPLYVGLDADMRSMPVCADGIILIGDAAGLESATLGDGIPQAWLSAGHAAEVAIEAVKSCDVSAAFLGTYAEKLKTDPIIQWSISGTGRHDLRHALGHPDEAKLIELVQQMFSGVGEMNRRLMRDATKRDPLIRDRWDRMCRRFYETWKGCPDSRAGDA